MAIALAIVASAPSHAAAKPYDATADVVVTAPARPDLFGTVAIPGPPGRWHDRWHRIATDDGAPSAELRALIAPADMLDRRAQLDYLQQAVDLRIGWRSDGTQYGERTYWASAAETLASGVGDDDDRAILKYQALRALGFPSGHLFLMVGRDRVRGDYVLLAARADGRWWLLEERGDRAVPAEGRTGFDPVASFGAGRVWVHGRRKARGAATVSAPSAGWPGAAP